MTAAKFSSVFDEIFLINFCLPVSSFNIVDMTNVDKILADTSDMGSVIGIGEDINIKMLDDRPADLSENPETARQDGMDDEDLLQLCSQRRWSTLCFNNKIASANLGDPKLYELSPIMKESDNTFCGNDRLCDLFTTFETINSPLWLNIGNHRDDESEFNNDVEALVMNIDEMNSPVPEKNSRIRICGVSDDNCTPLPLPTCDHDFPELNQFDQLSISDCRARKSNSLIKEEKSQKLKKISQKRSRMKQTTVTFFYDSDDEIKENSEDYDNMRSNSNNVHQPSKHELRTALGLIRKNKNIIQYSISNSGNTYIDSSTITGSTHAHCSNQRSCHSSHFSELDRIISPVNMRLQTWIRNVGSFTMMSILSVYIHTSY